MPRSPLPAAAALPLIEVMTGETLHAKRVASLTNAAVGVMHAGARGIHAIGTGLAAAQGLHAKHAIEQVDRLLSNPGLNVWELFAHWVPHVLGVSREIVVALDWTAFDADAQATVALHLVTRHGRSTPLVWMTVPTSQLKGRRNEYEDTALTRFHEVLPAGVTVTVLADRGFGDQQLYELLTALGLRFVIRFRGNGKCPSFGRRLPTVVVTRAGATIMLAMSATPVRCVIALLALIVGATSAVPVRSQSRARPDAPGTWKPWKPFTAIASARQEQSASPALVKAFESELLALNAILRRAAGVATPVGFSVETWGHLAGYRVAEHAPGQPAAGGLPLAGALTFGAFPIFEYERNGRTIREDTGETALQPFLVNQIGRGTIDRGNVPDWSALDTDAFLEPTRLGAIAGLPRYGDGLVIARDPEALWVPLSQRAALDLVAAARQLALRDVEESARASTARLAVVRDPAYRARRMKEAQQGAATMPDPQAFLTQIEEAIGIEEQSLVKELSPAGGTGRNLADATRALSEAVDWIAELSAEQLAAPACYASTGTTLRTRFPTVVSAGCHPLVRPNYGYFDKALPRSAPQVLIIAGITRCFDTADQFNRDANAASPAGCAANRALVDTLDTTALRAWLR